MTMTWEEARDWFLDNMPIKWLFPTDWQAQMQAIKALHFTSAVHDAAEMQRAYQTLKIARKEMDLSEMIFWLEVNSPWG